MLNNSQRTPFRELPEFLKGRKIEDVILRYFWHRLGYIAVQLSRIEEDIDRGPRLYVPPDDYRSDFPKTLIAPDLLCMRLTGWCHLPFELPDEFFADVKAKTRASWYRTNQAWQSGIDRRHWRQYCESANLTKKPVWVLHLIEEATREQMDKQGVPPGERPNPTGLYAHDVLLPIAPDPFDPEGRSRLVYWKIKDMIKIADLDEVMRFGNRGTQHD